MPTRTLDHGIPGILDGLSDELRIALEEVEVRVRYQDGELIQARGDRTRGLRIVRAGAVRLGNVGSDGEYLVLGIFGPGQTFGEMTLFSDLPRTFDAHASGPTQIGYIDGARMDRLMRDHPELARVFLRRLAMQLHAALEFVEDLRRLSVTIHIAKLLSTMAKAEKKTATLEVTHESLGKILGVTRLSVVRALDRLEEEGLIRRGYGRIEVPDVASLRAWVAESSKLFPVS
ncbi:MAG TPA: Crp/Fnr family transcriptional regulator [Polyangiales bacterium]|nr:Crp/Fnr family transcriptional regulator [Polyangiales bacterium]